MRETQLVQKLGKIFLLIVICLPLLAGGQKSQFYKDKGLLPYKKEPYFTLGRLDKLGRPTWAHIQFHDSRLAKADKVYRNPSKPLHGETGQMTDYLPGFQGNDQAYPINPDQEKPPLSKIWVPRHLLSSLWTDGAASNTIYNYGLITTYANEGFALSSETKPKGPQTLRDYEQALSDWVTISSQYWDSKKGHQRYMVDYKIELLYKGKELVPRQIKLRYVGLTEKGQLRKIDLEGKETFDKHGIATVVIDNVSPNVTIDYLTGRVTGKPYTFPKASPSEKPASAGAEGSGETVYVNEETGYYDYYVDDVKAYLELSEEEAIRDGYVWGEVE